MSGIDNKLPVAREGLPFILTFLLLAGLLAVPGWWWLAVPSGILGLFSIWFFRDPERTADADESAVLSPADGTVIEISEVHEDRFVDARMLKISIFMSIFNVHVNRASVSGRVDRIMYVPGKFVSANLDKASRENEHNAVVLETARGVRVVVVQIAGLIARRIVCWIKPGDRVVRGQRFGLIRFGSRLDVFLPLGTRIEVGLKQKVQAGQTILGYLP